MQSGRRWFYGTVALAAAAVVGSGVVLYLKLSSRTVPDAIPASSMATSEPTIPQSTMPNVSAPAMDVAVEQLEQRLRNKGGTGDDWALLARSYVYLRRYAEAVEAYAKALEKMPGNQAFIDGQAAARKAGAEMIPAR
jgi:cytochrome c-type biogenesis protein CcmH